MTPIKCYVWQTSWHDEVPNDFILYWVVTFGTGKCSFCWSTLHLVTTKHIKDRHPFNDFFSKITHSSWHQKGKTILDDGVAVASARPHANHFHLTPDRQPCQHLITQFFTGRMLFLMPNQQCQTTEGLTIQHSDRKCYILNKCQCVLTSPVTCV